MWWAAERPYRDNQRNWAIILGLLGVGVGLLGTVVVVVSSLVKARRRSDY